MSSTTIRLSLEHAKILRDLSRTVNLPMHVIAGQAIEDYRRKVLLEATNEAFQALRGNPLQWAEEVAERKAWEATLGYEWENRP